MMHARSHPLLRLSFLGAGCLLAACATVPAAPAPAPAPARTATSSPNRADLIRLAEREYPKDDFIVGYGVGDTAEQAEANARFDVAKQISDEISESTTSHGEESSGGGRTDDSRKTSVDLKEKVNTDAGEFINPVRKLTSPAGGIYQAIAVGDRAKLDDKFATDAARLLEKVTLAWDRALAADAKADPSGAATALCDADANEVAEIDRIDGERKAVTRHAAWTPEALTKRQQIEALRSRLKGSRISVYQPAAEEADVTDALVKRLGAAGYEAGLVTEPRCPSGGGLLVRVSLDQSCGSTILGQKCEAGLAATSQRCGGTESLFDEHSATATGLHATDPDLAKKAALKKLDTRKFVDMVAGRVLVALEGGCRR